MIRMVSPIAFTNDIYAIEQLPEKRKTTQRTHLTQQELSEYRLKFISRVIQALKDTP